MILPLESARSYNVETHTCAILSLVFLHGFIYRSVLGNNTISALFTGNIRIKGIKVLKSSIIYLSIYVLV